MFRAKSVWWSLGRCFSQFSNKTTSQPSNFNTQCFFLIKRSTRTKTMSQPDWLKLKVYLDMRVPNCLGRGHEISVAIMGPKSLFRSTQPEGAISSKSKICRIDQDLSTLSSNERSYPTLSTNTHIQSFHSTTCSIHGFSIHFHYEIWVLRSTAMKLAKLVFGHVFVWGSFPQIILTLKREVSNVIVDMISRSPDKIVASRDSEVGVSRYICHHICWSMRI